MRAQENGGIENIFEISACQRALSKEVSFADLVLSVIHNTLHIICTVVIPTPSSRNISSDQTEGRNALEKGNRSSKKRIIPTNQFGKCQNVYFKHENSFPVLNTRLAKHENSRDPSQCDKWRNIELKSHLLPTPNDDRD